ncbi:hypothetical protein FAM21834_00616 [Lentilactobacillus parabuchneri]|jgi:hypothetical protein|uniref:Uncharacterized protein n=2 Tax=Lentilactobacillus parabuchneri TaxID=152331 RepID=A0A1X1FGF4_9LACO|nr:hypothetical protein [Lentilactobacillus parabuchneri]APR06890.1 hypothetical protein FAM21731_00678 [Lentilactobacillus parabuchneri]KRM45776.1 hypothetical protein FC51_GL000686 [Lentilactobacillus parabuchneri DSM 5707 = NBRC 107865]KRN72301.1 hypothetical protein IV42_GL001436 [Lentilactobacillus parabuchneri]MBW0223385.1 hypothetical protein [Lentilactobacillus parabuchneri]MBW0246426.1 hypothetical protein [Lentilactobacillus parabuchneri]
MSEAEGAARQVQNYAEIHFITRDGDEIIEPLKIFRAVSEEYHIALPILNGYVLVNKPQHLTRVMGVQPAIINLVYGEIGSLHIYHGLTDMTGELIPLQNGDEPDQVAPVKLPDIDEDHHYYVMDEEGIGEEITKVNNYQPANPTSKVSLVSLTDAEKARVDKMERELSEGDNERILDFDNLKSELERPLDEFDDDEPDHESPFGQATYPGDEEPEDESSDDQPATPENDQSEPSPEQPDPTEQTQQQPSSPVESSSESTFEPNPAPQAEASSPQVPEAQATNVQVTEAQPTDAAASQEPISTEPQPTPIKLLAHALRLISQSLADTNDPAAISGLTKSADQMLSAIRTLANLDHY